MGTGNSAQEKSTVMEAIEDFMEAAKEDLHKEAADIMDLFDTKKIRWDGR